MDKYDEAITNYVNSRGRYTSPEKVIMNAFWFNLAAYVNIVRPQISFNKNIISANFFSITIGNSGVGKDFALDNTRRLIGIDEEKWEQVQLESYKSKETISVGAREVKISEYLPEFTISADNTNEGVYLRAKAHTLAFRGSVNITISEMFDYMNDNLGVSKELYDGKLLGKAIKGNINKNIKGIVSNLLLFGSVNKMKRDKKVKDTFRNHLETGLYRRSYIYFQEPQAKSRNDLNHDDYKWIEDEITEIVDMYIKKHITQTMNNEYPIMYLTPEAETYLDEIYNEFEKFEIDNFEHPLFQGEIGSMQKIISLAGLYSIISGDAFENVITKNGLEYAYNYHIGCRSTIHNIFTIEPQHMQFYKIINRMPSITKSEIMEQDDFDAKSFTHDINMLEELCYRKNQKLIVTGSKISKYKIEELPTTDLDKLIVTVGSDNRGAKTINFNDVLIPFDAGQRSLAKLVTSKKTDCFCLTHYDGKTRNLKNTLDDINIIAFDIDSGMSVKYAKQLLSTFTYILYTTKSNTDDFNRFRILLPAKHTISVSPEQYKGMIQNIADALLIPIIDTNALDKSRLWFVNPKAKVTIEKGELIDILPFIPETEKREYVQNQISNLKEPVDGDELDRRIYGIKRYYLNITIPNANRNLNMFKIFKFIKDIAGHNRAIIETNDFNNMLSEPLEEREMKMVTRG